MNRLTIEIYRMPEGDWACSVLCVVRDGYPDPVEAARGAVQILQEHWPEGVMPRRQPYVDAQWNPTAGKCWICDKETHWVEINYLTFICSAACLDEADKGYRTALKGGE